MDGTVVTLDASTSLALGCSNGISLSNNYLYGYEVVTGNAGGTLNGMSGVITSTTTNLGATTAETVTITNSRAYTTSVIVASINSPCTTGQVTVLSASCGTDGTINIVVYNLGGSACASTYKVAFFIANSA